VLAIVVLEASREHGLIEARIPTRRLWRAWRAPARVPAHVGILCREALAQLLRPRPVRGEFRAVRFRDGDHSHAVGRRALAEIFGSFAPNTIVLGIDPDRQLLLVHQLCRDGGRDELDVLELG
jgi:hypothetical protein